jgi:hypothetical protein
LVLAALCGGGLLRKQAASACGVKSVECIETASKVAISRLSLNPRQVWPVLWGGPPNLAGVQFGRYFLSLKVLILG